MINKNIMDCIIKIGYSDKYGTAFKIMHNAKTYLVTAKHIFACNDYPNEDDIFVFQNGNERANANVKIHYHSNQDVDIAVIEIVDDFIINFDSYLNCGDGTNMIYSQEVYYLGYPLNIDMSLPDLRDSPFPFVRRGIISAFIIDDTKKVLIDGMSNSGFSGGPIIVFDFRENKALVVGVISGFIHSLEPIVDIEGLSINDYKYKQNSGLVLAYFSSYIKEILQLIK